MKAIVKIVAPLSIALASLSANAAGVVETDYPLHQTGAAATAPASGAATASGYGLTFPHSEAAPVDAVIQTVGSPSRDDVQRKAAEPRNFDVGYFA